MAGRTRYRNLELRIQNYGVCMDYEEIRALKRDILSSLHCALPGTVVSFDSESQTAVIQPAVSRAIPSEVE